MSFIDQSHNVPLATSRFSAAQLIADSGLVPIRITLYPPRWPLKFVLGGQIKSVAPTRKTFAIEDDDEWLKAYRAQLDEVGPEAIARDILTLSAAHGGSGLVLLCFEDLHDHKKHGAKPAHLICHRISFAGWWLEQTGRLIPELRAEAQPALL